MHKTCPLVSAYQPSTQIYILCGTSLYFFTYIFIDFSKFGMLIFIRSYSVYKTQGHETSDNNIKEIWPMAIA